LEKENSILKILAYFNQFNYPLTKEEIIIFLDQKISSIELSDALSDLKNSGVIFQAGKFYSLQDDTAMYERRIKGNIRASHLLAKANKISKILFMFPFVRGVFISGSLSKNFAGEDTDIDFFIITAANRLWIARTMMHLLKKLSFIIGKQHCLCMNYYIDIKALEIMEQNEFTAIEVFTLIPSCGDNTVVEFYKINNWVNCYCPNYAVKKLSPIMNGRNSFIKKAIEFLFNNHFGNWLDDCLMKITNKRWKQKESEKKVNKNGRRMGLKTDKHFCKPNPDFFQKKLLGKYHSQLSEINRKLEKMNAAAKSASLN
jgi:hypothetical protein